MGQPPKAHQNLGRAAAKGRRGGKLTPQVSPRVSPRAGRMGHMGLVRMAHEAHAAHPSPFSLPRLRAHRWDPPEPSRTFSVSTGKFPNFFRNLEINFPYMNLILRTIPDLLVMSWIPSETPNNLRSPSYSISTYTTSNLKRVTLRFVNYADIVETPLRLITNSGIWRSIMVPTYSTMIQ